MMSDDVRAFIFSSRLSRCIAGRCVWHGSSTGPFLKSPVNSSSAIYRVQAVVRIYPAYKKKKKTSIHN